MLTEAGWPVNIDLLQACFLSCNYYFGVIDLLAVKYNGIGDVRTEDIPKPVCAPGNVLIKVTYAGICGSDLHIYRKGMFVTYLRETMGHEFSGVVESIGEGVQGLEPGDHVVGDPRVTCGKCRWCRQGAFNLCPELGFIGEVSPGCFAEYIEMNVKKILKVPPEINLRRAALVEPVAVALHAVDQGKITEKDSLGIVGAGPVGLLTIAVAKALRVKEITVLDISPARLELARRLGADKVITAFPEECSGAIDVAVDAVGKEITLNGILNWLNPKGRLVMVGLYEEKANFDPNSVVTKELDLIGVNAYETTHLERAIDFLIDCSPDIEQVITHVLPLESAGEAFSLLNSAGTGAAKILLAP